MAIAFAKLDETPSTANAQTYPSASYTPGADRGLVACCAASGTITAAALGSGNGLTWVNEASQQRATGNILHMFSALTGASPSAGAFTVDYTAADPGTGCGITIVEITGVDLTDFTLQVAKGQGAAAATPAVTFGAATAADSAILCMMVDGATNPPAITPPSGFTEITDNGFATPATGWEVAHHASPGSLTTVTWGSAATGGWAAMALELKPGTAASILPRRNPNFMRPQGWWAP